MTTQTEPRAAAEAAVGSGLGLDSSVGLAGALYKEGPQPTQTAMGGLSLGEPEPNPGSDAQAVLGLTPTGVTTSIAIAPPGCDAAPAPVFDWSSLARMPGYTADQLLDSAMEPDWIIEGMLPAGTMVIVAGPPKKARKTFLVMRAGLAVARGEPFLGKPTKKLPTYYVFLEDGRGRAGLRLRRLGCRRGETIIFNGIFDVAQFDVLLARLRMVPEPALVIVDPLVVLESAKFVVDENNGPAMEELLRPLREFAQQTRSGVLVIHHARKDGDEIRGSTAIKGSCDGWWFVKPREDGGGISLALTLRDGADGEISVNIGFPDEDEADDRPITFSTTEAAPSIDRLEQIRRVFRDLGDGERLSQNKIAEEARMSREQVKKPLQDLEQRGEVHRPLGDKKGYARGPNLLPAPKAFTW